MRRTSPRFFLAIATAAFFAGGSSLAISACSSSTTVAGNETDSSTAPDTSKPKPDAAIDDTDAGDAGTQTSAQCLAACDQAHANSTAKYNAVDMCWAASCKGPCVDQTGMFDAGDEAGDAGGENDGGTPLCGTMESSGVDKACDDCTTQYCCPSWVGCYNNTDCNALQDCYNQCP